MMLIKNLIEQVQHREGLHNVEASSCQKRNKTESDNDTHFHSVACNYWRKKSYNPS